MNTAKEILHTFALSLLISTSVIGAPRMNINHDHIEKMCYQLYERVKKDNFAPDLIIGLSRGGLVPLGYMAGEKMFNIRNTITITVKSYEQDKQGKIDLVLPVHFEDIKKYKSILVVDDIVDSGATIKFVTGMLKEALPTNTIKTAALFYKPMRSVIKPDYYVTATDEWIVFPWEK